MRLFDGAFADMCDTAVQQGVRVHALGDLGRLPPFLQATINRAVKATEHCGVLHVTLALSYGSRQDIVAAAQQLVRLGAQGALSPDEVDEHTVQQLLGTRQVVATVGEPDLLIRTSGEQRLSNFLLWELAYAELYFVPCLWPDFDETAFRSALEAFSARHRRFGSRQGLAGQAAGVADG